MQILTFPTYCLSWHFSPMPLKRLLYSRRSSSHPLSCVEIFEMIWLNMKIMIWNTYSENMRWKIWESQSGDRLRYRNHLEDVEVELVPEKAGILIRKQTSSKHPVDQVYGILNRPSDTDQYIEEVRGRWSQRSIPISCWMYFFLMKNSPPGRQRC